MGSFASLSALISCIIFFLTCVHACSQIPCLQQCLAEHAPYIQHIMQRRPSFGSRNASDQDALTAVTPGLGLLQALDAGEGMSVRRPGGSPAWPASVPREWEWSAVAPHPSCCSAAPAWPLSHGRAACIWPDKTSASLPLHPACQDGLMQGGPPDIVRAPHGCAAARLQHPMTSVELVNLHFGAQPAAGYKGQ